MLQRMNPGEVAGKLLDGEWGLLPDPMDRCRRQTWWASQRREGEFFPSYDDDAFWPTTVPGAWTRLHPELEYYEGTVVYLKHFAARPCEQCERAFLHFDGVADRASIFLNGHWLGEHDGGFVAFTVESTHCVAAENRLLVLVDNRRTDTTVPGWMHDWMHDGGIHRSVRLAYRPCDYVRDVGLRTRLDGEHIALELSVLIELTNRSATVDCEAVLQAPNGRELWRGALAAEGGTWSQVHVSLPRESAPLWSPANPQLCRLTVCCGADHWEDTVGLREIRPRGREILLNGEPIILRGVCTWNEDPERGIFNLGPAASEATIALLRELNCNFARAGHQPNSPDFVRACDRAGILLWLEVPAYWLPEMHKPTQSRRALDLLAGLIRQYRNNPSVIIWSIGNECLLNRDSAETSNLDYFLEAADLARREDPGRLVTYTGGMEGAGHEDLAEILPPAIVDKLDVVGFNSYAGLQDGVDPTAEPQFPQNYAKARRASGFGKPVIHAEVGIDAVKGREDVDFGEPRQAAYYERIRDYFRAMVAEGCLQGMTPFVLNDYRTPIKLGRHQAGYNRKGLITPDGSRKTAFHILRDTYAEN